MSAIFDMTKFTNLDNWSVYSLLENIFEYNKNFELVKIGNFLTRNKTKILINDEIIYKRVTIKMNNNGIFLRDTKIGKAIGTKNQFTIKEGQFLLSKIDARNGAFGVVTKEVDKAIITGNFWTFDVDYTKVNPHFLSLITTTKQFMKFAQSASSGTTGRHYLKEDKFLNVKIPLPSLDIQKNIVQNYQDKLDLAVLQERQTKDKETEIEEYLYKELGIKIPKKKEKTNSLLEFINFRNLSIWSYEQINSNSSFSCDTDIKCNISTLENMCILKKKPFRKKEYEKSTFNYVDIGSINPLIGITETKEINISKTPSRATQHINTGDLIIATTRPYLKKFAIVDEKFDNNVCSSGFAILEYNPTKYNLEFIKEFLQSFYGIEQLKEKMTGGLYPAITSTELKSVKIPNPDIEIQDKIAFYIKTLKDEIKELKAMALENKALALVEFEKEIFSND
jgi:restriction endonuclease S subunit